MPDNPNPALKHTERQLRFAAFALLEDLFLGNHAKLQEHALLITTLAARAVQIKKRDNR
jgi:hypothetical protein